MGLAFWAMTFYTLCIFWDSFVAWFKVTCIICSYVFYKVFFSLLTTKAWIDNFILSAALYCPCKIWMFLKSGRKILFWGQKIPIYFIEIPIEMRKKTICKNRAKNLNRSNIKNMTFWPLTLNDMSVISNFSQYKVFLNLPKFSTWQNKVTEFPTWARYVLGCEPKKGNDKDTSLHRPERRKKQDWKSISKCELGTRK